MKRTMIAVLMAFVFGLFSMPALQAAPGNGWAVGSALKALKPLKQVRWYRRYRRRRRCVWVHRGYSRRRYRCW
jgi:hypothetical protein